MARKTVLLSLIDLVNQTNGKKYPDTGYLYYAGGIGIFPAPKLWVITNDKGGVTLSDLNRSTPHLTRNALRGYIMAKTATNKESI